MNKVSRFVPAVVIFLLTIVLWEAATTGFEIPRYVLPSPSDAVTRGWEEAPNLLRHARWSATAAVLGFLLALVIAVVAASLFVHVTLLERTFMPWAIIIQTIPIVAIAPLLTVWLGFGLAPKVAIAAIISFFPVLVNCIRGLRSIHSEHLEFMRMYSASWWQIFAWLRVPSSLSYLFAGLKVATTLSMVGAIVAEFMGSDRGIGFVIVQAAYRLDTTTTFAAIFYIAVVSMMFYQLVALLERVTLYWPGARGAT